MIQIARKIRRLYREKMIRTLRDVGVTFPIIEHYEQIVREIFPRYGIPFTMFQGFSLGSSPVVVTIFRMLNVILEGYSPESLVHFFSSPFVECHGQEKNTPDTVSVPLCAETYHEIDALVRELDIRGGRREWIEKLTTYRQALEEQPSEGETSSPARLAESLLPAAFGFLEVFSQFETEPSRSVKDYADVLRKAIQQFRIPTRILLTNQRKPRDHDVAALRAFLKLLETVQQEFAPSSAGSFGARGVTFRAFYDLLRTTVRANCMISLKYLTIRCL